VYLYGTRKYNLNPGKYFIAHQANTFSISILILEYEQTGSYKEIYMTEKNEGKHQ